MSTPYNGGGFEPYPEHPEGSHPENGAGSYNAGNSPTNPGNYGAQNQPGQGYAAFEVNSAASMAGSSALRFHGQQLTDNVPGDGTSPHPINDPASNGWYHVKGTGKLQVMEALSWAVKAMMANAKFWIPVGIAFTVLIVLTQFFPGPVSLMTTIAVFLLVPWLLGVALQQTLVKHVTYNDAKAPAYGKTIGMTALLGFVGGVAMFILMMVLAVGALSTLDPSTVPDPNAPDADLAEMWEFIRPILGALTVSFVVAVLVGPFFLFQSWYAADNNGSFGDAFSAGLKAGASNYLPILGLGALLVLLNIVGGILFFLGFIVSLPVTFLAVAHAYRQVSCGPVPKEAVATA